MARTLLRMFALASAILFTADLLLRLIPAGADTPTPPRLTEWVDFNRQVARTKLGPFDLHDPRLASATCTEDGLKGVLTYESPITSERTTLVIKAAPGGGPAWPDDTPNVVTEPTDPSWCGRVPVMFPVPMQPPL